MEIEYGCQKREKRTIRAVALSALLLGAAVCGLWERCTPLGVSELASYYREMAKQPVSAKPLAETIASHFLLDGGDSGEAALRYPLWTESELSYEAILAREEAGEHSGETGEEGGEAGEGEDAGQGASGETISGGETASDGALTGTVSREKLADFDYLIQNFYQVDNTTTITSEQLSAETMLAQDLRLAEDTGAPQILIYHTHSQEAYADSVEGDASTTVVGVGEELTRLLTEEYGLRVLHHTGEYDVEDRDHAYAQAGPALEQILAEYPTIEVVIDLHRDGVREDTRLVTEQDGVSMAQVMFFNGLSRTTALGEIGYLYNPYLADNLAFSFQMQLAAAERYPGFTRRIYLKGYRYNMHYCPKTLLVEVGAQTNTVAEAKNAMRPLAELLHFVLTQ